MKKPHHLEVNDIREVFRIVQEAIDLGNDPVAWRMQMLLRMNKLIGAYRGACMLIPIEFSPENLRPYLFVYTPMSQRQEKLWMKLVREPNVAEDPFTLAIQRVGHQSITKLRRELLDDKTWYGSPRFDSFYKALGVDDLIHSHDPMPQLGVNATMNFTRRLGDAPFTRREAGLVDLLREELRHRWLGDATKLGTDGKLTPRLQQLLSHLTGPTSVKEIATYLGLSTHTAHNYVKELYRRLGVSSRAELVHRNLATTATILPKIGYKDL